MVNQSHAFLRCVRCLHQKKGCEGYPCQRCSNVNAICVPEKNPRRRLRPDAPSGQQVQPAASAQPFVTTSQPFEDEDGLDATEEQRVGLDDPSENAVPGIPRIDSLRTKASGPDTWPMLRWSWVGNGQYCRREGYERVMAKKRAATEARKAKTEALFVQSGQETRARGGEEEQTPRPSSAQASAAYGMDAALSPFGGSSQHAAVRTDPINTFSYSTSPPIRVSSTTSQEAIRVDMPQDIVAAQQQHEAFYARFSNIVPSTAYDRDSVLMPPPPRPNSRAPPVTATAPPTRSSGFVQSFENIRSTHATEAQYAQIRSQLPRQRVSTPPLAGQNTIPQSILMQPLDHARRNHATDAEYAALTSTLTATRADTPPFPGQGNVAGSRSSTYSAPATSTSSQPTPSPWWVTPLDIPVDSVGFTRPPHHSFNICLGCLQPAHPWQCDRPYFRRFEAE